MSILPSLNIGGSAASSSSSSSSQSSPSHEFVSSSYPLPQLHQSQHNLPSDDAAGQVAPAASYTGGSSQKVNGRGRWSNGRSTLDQNATKSLRPEVSAQEVVGCLEPSGEPSEFLVSASGHRSGTSVNSHGTTRHPTGRRGQMISGNHLLNFHYDPVSVSRPQPRPLPPRRPQKRRPYNKDLFFQANYKFVVLDSGNYTPESMDPDKMLHWEDIICLRYSTSVPVQCPICLDDPLCPQITSCGHIFCFPCILQYFDMGEDDHKGECWKKCPLCFTMISSKDLYTIQIQNVKQYHVGDELEFILLSRQKGSFTSSVKYNEQINADEEILDSFAKFSLTSDVELSVREAMSDLDSWIARADSGLVDDIERLPYVCAAMEQLERRKKHWNDHCFPSGSMANTSLCGSPATVNDADAFEYAMGKTSTVKDDKSSWFEKPALNKAAGDFCVAHVADSCESFRGPDQSLSSSNDANVEPQKLNNSMMGSKDGDSYNFYQAIDGQHLILHPLNMKCLLHHYGSYERLPNKITGKILQLDTVTQSEAMRRRYRFLSHFSLTTTFQLCEIDLSDMLPAESLAPYRDEIKSREKQRKRLARKESKYKVVAEIADTQFVPVPCYSYDSPPIFSMDDFEALGSPAVASSSPPTLGERQSFSSVARLGFAAGYGSPALKTDEMQAPVKIDPPYNSSSSSSATGTRDGGTLSFANVTSRSKSVEVAPVPKANEPVKKGKKPTRVLLSTAGGRRY